MFEERDEYLRDDDPSSRLGEAREHAGKVQSSILEQWAQSESLRPTQPFRVLGINAGSFRSKKYLKDRLLARIVSGMEKGPPQGAAKILLIRAKRAYELIVDDERFADYKEDLHVRIEQDTLANLRFANGFYEGDVPEESMEDGQRPVRHGKGFMLFNSGEVFEGEFHEDVRAGIGVSFWQSGDLYLGQWAHDCFHGRGVYFYNQGNSYIGEFADGLPHGEGLQSWKDGSAYAGHFVAGIRTGSGIMELPRSQEGKVMGIYMGDWKDNRMHGKGHWELHDKNHEPRIYVGEFVNDQFHGQGRLVEPSGEVYEGTFVRGTRHGKGSNSLPCGEHYEGDFSKNFRHGLGKARVMGENDTVSNVSGPWENNLLHGDGKLRIESIGETWEMEGQFEHGKLESKGIIAYPSGARYEGKFKHGQMHGQGSFTFKDGSSWDGIFEDSKSIVNVKPAGK